MSRGFLRDARLNSAKPRRHGRCKRPFFALAASRNRPNEVFADPTKSDRLVFTTKDGVYLYEPASGNSVLLSY
ncbi:hypothetical protein BH09MYX1_BH09MYX1_28510 [soil metagenome]